MRKTTQISGQQRGPLKGLSHGQSAAPAFFKNRNEKIETILNRLISKRDYGLKWQPKKGKAHPIHCNTKEELLAFYTGKLKDRYGNARHWLSSITLDKWDRHFRNLDTFYFTGSTDSPYTLVMIDIDCHAKGTYAGAVQCAEFLKNHFFPDLFFEPSTNLNGVHGYFVLKTAGMTPEEINLWESELQAALQCFQNKFDIELIEIKGHCHVVEHTDIKHGFYSVRRITNVNCGTLAKCPRTVRQRKEEFLDTTVVDPATFVMPRNEPQVEIHVIEKGAKTKVTAGSTTGKCIGDWKKLMPLAKQMLGGCKGRLVGDVRVTPEDVAILLAITNYCTSNMNADGSMPTKRIRGFWDAMWEAGETDRAFIPRRYKATRDFLDAAGAISWKSNHYTLGIACKWQLTEDMVGVIESCFSREDREETSFVSSRTWVLKPDELITRPERLEERVILPEDIERAIGWRKAA